jgi:HK97 family phage major capsid protein
MDLAALKTTIDEHQSATAEVLQQTTKDLKALAGEVEKLELRLNRPGVAGMHRVAAGEIAAKAFASFIRKGREGLDLEELKSLQVADDTAGGYLAPEEFVRELLRNLVLFSPIRSIARVMKISGGSALLPKRTGGMTASWVPEVGQRPETTVAFAQNRYPVCELAAYIDVSNTLLDDAQFDVAAELAFEFAEEFGRAEQASFVNGSHPLQPTGFMTDSEIGYTPSGHASQITADGLIDLFHALKPAYRGAAVWLMNSATLGAVRKLKDPATGTYLLVETGLANSPATTILGRPVLEAADMPNIAGNAFPVVLGDFGQGYRVFDRVQLSVLRDPYSQAVNGMTRFHGRRRVAGGVGKAEAIRKLKIATA